MGSTGMNPCGEASCLGSEGAQSHGQFPPCGTRPTGINLGAKGQKSRSSPASSVPGAASSMGDSLSLEQKKRKKFFKEDKLKKASFSYFSPGNQQEHSCPAEIRTGKGGSFHLPNYFSPHLMVGSKCSQHFGIFPPIPMKTYPGLDVPSPRLRCSRGCGEGAVDPVSVSMGWINISVGRAEWLRDEFLGVQSAELGGPARESRVPDPCPGAGARLWVPPALPAAPVWLLGWNWGVGS